MLRGGIMELEEIKQLRHNIGDVLNELGVDREFQNDSAYRQVILKIQKMMDNYFVDTYPIIEKKANLIKIADINNKELVIEVIDGGRRILAIRKLENNNAYIGELKKIFQLLDSNYYEKNSISIKSSAVSYWCIDDSCYQALPKYYREEYVNGIEMKKVICNFDSSTVESNIPFSYLTVNPRYKLVLKRYNFDTATLTRFDNGILSFNSRVKLNDKYGYQKMKVNDLLAKPVIVYIPGLSEDNVTDILAKEKDEEIRKALAQLTFEREIDYNSLNDKDYFYRKLPSGKKYVKK